MLRRGGRSVCVLACLALACIPASGWALTTAQALTLSSATAIRTGSAVSVRGMTTAVFHVSGTFEGTVAFKASVDGLNFEALGCANVKSNSGYQTETTERGLFRCNVVGINTSVRADVTQFLGGSVTVTVGLTSAGLE